MSIGIYKVELDEDVKGNHSCWSTLVKQSEQTFYDEMQSQNIYTFCNSRWDIDKIGNKRIRSVYISKYMSMGNMIFTGISHTYLKISL